MADETPGPGALWKAAEEGSLADVESLLAGGADASEPDEHGVTPLIHAARHGHADVVKRLLKAGAPWNALDPSGRSAGDYAMHNGHQAAFDILLDVGLQAELILGASERRARESASDPASRSYLKERVEYSEDRLVDEESKAVMMAWETPLMEAHARAVCDRGGDILNVGFGMGLVDTAIQRYNLSSHTIIEAHPDVHARMLASGWGDKPNVTIVQGRWQDVVPQLGQFDGIFFDTYGEYYEDLKEFHSFLPRLLKPGGTYSFFNGLCADYPFFHVVYCQLVALELARLGFGTQFIPLPVKSCFDETTWEEVERKYWQLDTYFLPVCEYDEDSDVANPPMWRIF